MRTLNKALCLILALVMILGLGAFSVSAEEVEGQAEVKEYTDGDNIIHTEAVDVLSVLGIINGRTDGNFDPKAELTRRDGAVLATRMLGMDGVTGSDTFLDTVDDAFYRPYIGYIQREGIINGYDAENFGPLDPLTGAAYAKMMLGALGYNQEIEGMTGPQWEISVAKLVRATSLDDGVRDLDLSKPINREQASQMTLNTLKTPMVEYDSTTTITVNDAVVSIGNQNWKYKLSNTASQQTIKDKRDVNATDADSRFLVEFAEEYWKDLRLFEQSDDFGRPTNKWTYKNNKIGEYAQVLDLVEIYTGRVNRNVLYNLLGSAVKDSISDGYSTLEAYVDGINVHTIDKTPYTVLFGLNADEDAVVDDYMHRDNTSAIGHVYPNAQPDQGTGNGAVTEVYMDGDNNVTLVTYHYWVYQTSSNYNSTTDSINLSNAGDSDQIVLKDRRLLGADFPEIKDYKADDYILVTAAWDEDSASFDVKSTEKAELLTGIVDTYVNDTTGNDFEVTIDGQVKKYSQTALHKIDNDGVRDTKYSVGVKATLVLDKYGFVIAVDSAITTNDYLFVREFGRNNMMMTSSNAYAVVAFADGSRGTIKVKSVEYPDGTSEKNVNVINNFGLNGTAPGQDPTEVDFDVNNLAKRWYVFSKNAADEYTLSLPESKYYFEYNDQGYSTGAVVPYEVAKGKSVYYFQDTNNESLWGVPAYAAYRNRNAAAVSATRDDEDVLIANNDTIVITNENGNLEWHTGVKNLPNITIQGVFNANTGAFEYNGSAKVYALRKQGGSIALAFIDGNEGMTVTGGNSANLIYVTKYAGANYSSGAETSWKYVTLDWEGKEVVITADSKIANVNTYYQAKYHAGKNSSGIYTEFDDVAPGESENGKIIAYSGVGTIEADGGLLEFNGEDRLGLGQVTVGFADNAKMMVVVTKGAPSLMKDSGADYEVHTNLKASDVENITNKKDVVWNFEAKLDEERTQVVEEIYITITGVADEQEAVGFVVDTYDYDNAKDAVEAVRQAMNHYTDVTVRHALVIENDQLVVPAGVTLRVESKLLVGNVGNVGGTMYVYGDLIVNNLEVYGDLYVDSRRVTAAEYDAGDFPSVTVTGRAYLDGNTYHSLGRYTWNVFRGPVTVDGGLELAYGGLMVFLDNVVITANGEFLIEGDVYVSASMEVREGTVRYTSGRVYIEAFTAVANSKISNDILAVVGGAVPVENAKVDIAEEASAEVTLTLPDTIYDVRGNEADVDIIITSGADDADGVYKLISDTLILTIDNTSGAYAISGDTTKYSVVVTPDSGAPEIVSIPASGGINVGANSVAEVTLTLDGFYDITENHDVVITVTSTNPVA